MGDYLPAPMRTLLLSALLTPALAAPLPPEQQEFFESRIRPVLVTECMECHGAEKQKGGLRLDYAGGWKAGGDTGAVIVPGKPGESLLMKSIRHEDPELKMPAKRPKLGEAAIGDFEKWIAMGAPDPRDKPGADVAAVPWEKLLEERRKWWSLAPVKAPPPPAVREEGWSAQPVDRFLLARMEAAGLAPVADADAHTLYRRLSYTLTGLPPAREEAEAFAKAAAQDRAGAIAQAADRMLASPRFGEHWGRHWLDLVRYAETHGSEGDPAIPQAWRYRDYIIRAINEDVPVDRLIREHIAGDQISPRWNRQEGWNEALLGLAHFRLVEHGFQPIDTRDEQVKVVDSQIDVLTKAFQGMTVSCARCHDHKFDAISQRDYTALAGVLESSRPAMVTLDDPALSQAPLKELAAQKAGIQQALCAAWLEAAERIPAQLRGEVPPAVAEAKRKLGEQEKALVELEKRVRARAAAARGTAAAARLPQPIARWAFEADAKDQLGPLHGELVGGAVIREGRLVLDGREAHVRTAPLGRPLREKTLEAWVALPAMEQGGGGVITVESANGAVFDSLVFAEKEPRRWMAGSDFYRRSRAATGPEEAAKPGELIHLVVVYRADHGIAIFRNGQPYGVEWTPANPLVAYEKDARLLFGRRHTGGGRATLAGEIEEARLYDRAITAEEIRASFEAGPSITFVKGAELEAMFTAEERAERARLRDSLPVLRNQAGLDTATAQDPWEQALADARGNPANPLHAWATRAEAAPAGPSPTLAGIPAAFALRYTHGPGVAALKAGDFTIPPKGGEIAGPLQPAGTGTGLLTRRHGGIASSARFKITTDFISIRAAGANAQCRLIIDGYPLGVNPIYPRALLNTPDQRWLKMDTKYRKGSWAYLEFATAADQSRAEKSDDRSWFAVSGVVAHDDAGPRDESTHAALLAVGSGDLATRYRDITVAAIGAWREGRLSEPQRAWLDFFIQRDLLPARLAQHPGLAARVEQYRALEESIPVPRRAPGVVEGDGQDTALLPRGDHLKPAGLVPRGYLGVLGTGSFPALGETSGRLPLAEAITAPGNPLTEIGRAHV